jgi:hypothetical protein
MATVETAEDFAWEQLPPAARLQLDLVVSMPAAEDFENI